MFNKFAGLQYERPWLKGQPSPLELIYSHYLLRLNIPSDYNDFGFNSFQKIILKIVSEYDQEIPQSQTADYPVAPRGRVAQPSRDTRKTN